MGGLRSTGQPAGHHAPVPALPPQLVERATLLARLDAALDAAATHPVVWVTAPAGFGKSSLIATWWTRRCTLPVRWVQASAGQDQAQLAELLGVAIDGLAAAASASVLVIDGVDSPDELHVVSTIANETDAVNRAAVRLVIAGRCLPPPAIASMQLSGTAVHLDRADLELDGEEVAAVVRAHSGAAIGAETAGLLAARLEGWIAGAAMVGMSHPGGDPDAAQLFDAAFNLIDDYVTAEIVAPLAEEVQRFLIMASCVEEIGPGLGEAVTGRQDSEGMLNTLRTAGFPVSRHGSRDATFRIFGPVRESLDSRARQTAPSERTAALRAAAHWYSTQRRPLDAAACWVRLGDWEQVTATIGLHLQWLLEANEVGSLADLLARIPPTFLREHAELVPQSAAVLQMDGRVSAAQELLSVYEPFMSDRARVVADVTRSSVSGWAEDVEVPLVFADAAIAAADALGDDGFDRRRPVGHSLYARAGTDTFRTLAHSNALVACAYDGLWDRGERHLLPIRPETVATLAPLQAVQLHGNRATYLALAGRAVEALAEARLALAAAGDWGLMSHRSAADAHYAHGEAQRLLLHHRDADAALGLSRALAETNGRRNLVSAIIAAQAALLIEANDARGAVDSIERLRAGAPQRLPRMLACLLATTEARAASMLGDHRRALRVLDAAPSLGVAASARVVVCLASAEFAAARSVVEHWPDDVSIDSIVRRFLAVAAVADASGDTSGAVASVRAAVRAAAQHQLLQPFVEIGPLITRLLQRADGDHEATAPEVEFIRRLQAIIAGGTVGSVAPRFTAREAAILARLADGLSLAEVARDIHLSINTVKTYVKAIYRKLGVTNRIDALRAWTSVSSARSELREP